MHIHPVPAWLTLYAFLSFHLGNCRTQMVFPICFRVCPLLRSPCAESGERPLQSGAASVNKVPVVVGRRHNTSS
jgi:hypothetical protein